jgi:WD40 repeat protein
LVSTSEDALAIVWDTTSWEVSQRLEGHDASVSNAALDPVRNELATASIDGTVKVWDLDTGVARLTLPGGPFTDVSYSSDGRYLAAATDHGEVQVFMIDLDELVAESESRLTRGFTDAECAQYLHLAECPSQ